jgi:transaldolase
VEELIGPDTVNTMPPQTVVAFLDHGKVRLSLEEDIPAAHQTLANLESLGISMKEVTTQLEDEGVKSFSDAFTVLLKAVADRRRSAVAG